MMKALLLPVVFAAGLGAGLMTAKSGEAGRTLPDLPPEAPTAGTKAVTESAGEAEANARSVTTDPAQDVSDQVRFLRSLPRSLIQNEARRRSELAFGRMDEVFPLIQSRFETGEESARFFGGLMEKAEMARHFHLVREGSFRYSRGERTYDVTVVFEFFPAEVPAECSQAALYVWESATKAVMTMASCSLPMLRTRGEDFLVDFDIADMSDEDIGERLLVEVPYLSSGNQAILLEEGEEEPRKLSVSWREHGAESAAALQERLERASGVYRVPALHSAMPEEVPE